MADETAALPLEDRDSPGFHGRATLLNTMSSHRMAQSLIELQERYAALRVEVEWLAGRIHDKAMSYGWCDDYDGWVEEVNEHCKIIKLPERSRRIELVVSLRLQCNVTNSVDLDEVERTVKDVLRTSIPDHAELEFLDDLGIDLIAVTHRDI